MKDSISQIKKNDRPRQNTLEAVVDCKEKQDGLCICKLKLGNQTRAVRHIPTGGIFQKPSPAGKVPRNEADEESEGKFC